MKTNISSESVFRSAYMKGNFTLDPNSMIQLMFSLEKSLLQCVTDWNEDIYRPLSLLLQSSNDVNAWKTGLDARSIIMRDNDIDKTKWWNIQRDRPQSVLEAMESLATLISATQTILTRASKLSTSVLSGYLTTRFIDLLDTPSSYLFNSLVEYSELNKELVYAPFSTLGLTGPSDFLGMTDTPVAFLSDQILVVNQTEDAVEYEYDGYLSRNVPFRFNSDFDLGDEVKTFKPMVVIDASSNTVDVALTPMFDKGVVVSLVSLSFANVTRLVPTGDTTFEESASPFTVTSSQMRLYYDELKNDFKIVGEDA